MSNLVAIEHIENVLIVTLNRPERKNAFSKELLGELCRVLENEAVEDTSAIILRGAGECFSAGADISELEGTIDDIKIDDAFDAVTSAIRKAPVPVIAAIDGPCMGGAFDVAISCDVRFAAKNTIFQVPATRAGLLYSPKALLRMYKALGRDTLMRIMVLGERMDAEVALSCGIVSKVSPANSCFDDALSLAKSTANNVSIAVDATKTLLNSFEANDYDPEHWEALRRALMSSPERKQAVEKIKLNLARK